MHGAAWCNRKFAQLAGKITPRGEGFVVRVHVLVIYLADLKAKPDANLTNPYPLQAWSCQICNQSCAMSSLRN
jgi:hypothetical protein